jgi:hypothetical protein
MKGLGAKPLACRSVAVKCLEIKEKSVVVQIEGIEQHKEIGLR